MRYCVVAGAEAKHMKNIIKENTLDADKLKQVENFGTSVIDRLVSELGATRTAEHPELQDIKNLAGDSTGFVHVYAANKLIKATSLSINVAPGMRYFNIHIVPDLNCDAPRFSAEGMVTVQGSQISMDMYPDLDTYLNIRPYLDQMSGVQAVFDEAKATDIDFQPSRMAHMRVFCSPFFLNAPKTTAEQLDQVGAFVDRYFDEWLKLLAHAAEVDATASAQRQARRSLMSDVVIEKDPDRNMIVQVYGEATTSAIEKAVMYW
jgi:hypothetical protein